MSSEGFLLSKKRPYRLQETPAEGKRRHRTDAGLRSAPAAPALPCLHSNNSNERAGKEDWNTLQGNHRKSARLLELHVRKAVEICGIQTLGFLTLTFAQNITCSKEAQRRLNSLMTRIIRPRYGAAVIVLERTKKKRIHFHLLVPVGKDIRTGVDFEGIEKGNYSSAGPDLRAEWSFWRRTAPKYGFGRTELLPIKSSESAIARYVSKYISKHIEERSPEDKGVRLVRVSGVFKAGTTRFGWNTTNFRLWREKVGAILKAAGCEEMPMGKALGRQWLYRHQDIIQSVELPDISEELRAVDQPPTMAMASKLLAFWEEHGCARMSAREAVLAIGQRTHEGRMKRYSVQYFNEENDDEETRHYHENN